MKSKYNSVSIKYTFLISCMLLLFTTLPARSQSNSSFLDKFSIGFSGGLNFPKMVYSDPTLSSYGSSLLIGSQLGIFSEIQLSKNFSIRPEVLITDKGQFIDYENIYYKFNPYYIDWRLPFLLNFGKPDGVRPYIMIAPAMGFVYGGSIYLEDGSGYYYSTDITDANILPIEISIVAGAGLKIPLKFGKSIFMTGLEVAYNWGLSDTYSVKENDGTAIALNQNYSPMEGTRKNRGLSVTASIAIPFSNFKRPEVKKEPVKEIVKEEKKEEIKIEEKEIIKSCYTIEEINTLIDAKKNVKNKVICMNNLKFDFNKSTLDKDSKTYLENMVRLLEKVPSMKMKISGHTDNVGSNEYNLDLSKKRAAAVYEYLTGRGISKNRLSYEYYGATRPLSDNDSEEHRAQNRRVEFEIIEK